MTDAEKSSGEFSLCRIRNAPSTCLNVLDCLSRFNSSSSASFRVMRPLNHLFLDKNAKKHLSLLLLNCLIYISLRVWKRKWSLRVRFFEYIRLGYVSIFAVYSASTPKLVIRNYLLKIFSELKLMIFVLVGLDIWKYLINKIGTKTHDQVVDPFFRCFAVN